MIMNYNTDPTVIPTFGNAINRILGRFGSFTVEIDGDVYTANKLLEWNEAGDPPTEDEVNAALAALKAEYPMHMLRAKRDSLLAETDWVVSRAVDLSNDGLGIQLPQVWVDYRQALRDLPANTTDPANPVWPVKPQ